MLLRKERSAIDNLIDLDSNAPTPRSTSAYTPAQREFRYRVGDQTPIRLKLAGPVSPCRMLTEIFWRNSENDIGAGQIAALAFSGLISYPASFLADTVQYCTV